MANILHLNKAPIVEAIIDFRVILPKNIIEKLSELPKELHEKYPLKKPLKRLTGNIDITESKSSIQQTEEIGGYIFRTADEKNVVQFRVDGFTFSRLYPYTYWVSFRDEAKTIWGVYCSITNPEVVRRIAVRYINRIELNLPCELGQYFTAPIRLPNSLPQEFISFLTRITVCQDDLKANITQTTQELPDRTKMGIIFDIDVYKEDNSGIPEEVTWPTFERLRNLKNRIFFESIKEKTVEMYK